MKILDLSNPRSRAVAVAAMLLVPLLSFAAWYVPTMQQEQDDFPVILKQYGYSAMALPSRLFGPGTIMTVETLRSGALDLHLACRVDDAELEQRWQSSPAMEMSFKTGVKQTFRSSALAHKLIDYGLFGERASATDLSLQDIKIVTLPYSDLIALRSKYLREACEQAVVWNLKQGAKVCQSEEVLQADVVYKNAANDRIDIDVKLKPIESAGASGKIDNHGTLNKTGKGDDLFLGIKVRLNHCFTLSENGRDLVGSL
jgi:hypothetical protein